jgi:hypothetical protein
MLQLNAHSEHHAAEDARSWALLCLVLASSSCAKMLGQNHFAEWNWTCFLLFFILTYLLTI